MKEVNLNGETIGNLRVILECLALGLKGKKWLDTCLKMQPKPNLPAVSFPRLSC